MKIQPNIRNKNGTVIYRCRHTIFTQIIHMSNIYEFSGGITFNISDEHKNALNELKQNIQYMNPEPVVEHLYSNKALSLEETEMIKSKDTKTEQSTALLETLEQHKDWVYYCLLDGLYRSSQGHVVDILNGGTITR